MTLKPKTRFALGLSLTLIGLLVIAFSSKIVFPGLERLIGIETIVGKENVVYQSDGSYVFTNPLRMVVWVASVAMGDALILSLGIWISGIRIRFPSKNNTAKSG